MPVKIHKARRPAREAEKNESTSGGPLQSPSIPQAMHHGGAGHSFAKVAVSSDSHTVQRRESDAEKSEESWKANRDMAINSALFAAGFLPGIPGLAAGVLGGTEAVRQAPGKEDPSYGMKTGEAVAGYADSIFGTAAGLGGFEASSAAELGASSVFGGAGLEGAAVLGPGALVAGAGLFGMGVGHYLSEQTEVGDDTQDSLGALDRGLSKVGLRTSTEMDNARQENWDKGNYASAAGNLLGEAAVGTAGAIGGLGVGAWHGMEKLGTWLAADDLNEEE